MINRIFLLFLVFLAPLTGYPQQTALLKGRVIQVADGDSFTLLLADKQKVRIRLYGVDCPEYKQDFSRVAADFTKACIAQKEIKVKPVDKDQYGRVVGIVFLRDGSELNAALLENGLAWHYTFYDSSSKYAALEKRARSEKIGLWSMPNPQPPWEYRRKHRRK